jgi:putative copper export protein/mono/diheme cytochrome c family protein/peroxiredoxin
MSELAALVRFVHLTAAIVLTGGFGFQSLIARPAFAASAPQLAMVEKDLWQSQLRLWRWCVALLFATAILTLWLQTANVSGSTPTGLQAVYLLLTQTQFGTVWSARLALLIVIAALVARQTTTPANPFFVRLGFTLSAGLLAASAFAGHAAAADGVDLALQLSADAIHLLAAGTWLGGLPPLAALLRQSNRKTIPASLPVCQTATRRFSNLALASVGALIVTGSYNAWTLVGGVVPLFGTAYGKLLLIKLALLLPLVFIGALNRLRLTPIIAQSNDHAEQTNAALRRLSRNLIIEVFLGMVILLIVGHMGVTPPARHVQPQWPFSFRWDWTTLEKAPKIFAEVQRGTIWLAVGVVAFTGAMLRRPRNFLAILIAIATLTYAIALVHQAIMIDAYPDTYKRPAVAYQAISIANGAALYQDSGCAACHGVIGQGDGPVAAELDPPPPDLTARHANAHTAGDLFWWLSYGVKPTSAMPGFSHSLNDEERWDLINYLRALSSGERAKNLAPVIEDKPWLVAPDFAYETNDGQANTLKDHRGNKMVLLIILNLQDTEERLRELGQVTGQLEAADVAIIVVPSLIDRQFVDKQLPGLIVSEGIREIVETYKLFASSFNNENPMASTPHAEFLIDKQGYIRARWLPAENTGWRKFDVLMQQLDALRKEKPTAPAPDEHVH